MKELIMNFTQAMVQSAFIILSAVFVNLAMTMDELSGKMLIILIWAILTIILSLKGKNET